MFKLCKNHIIYKTFMNIKLAIKNILFFMSCVKIAL